MNRPWPSVKLGEVLGQRKQFVRIDDFASYKRCRVQLHAQGIVLRDQVQGTEVKTKTQQLCRAGEFLVAEIDGTCLDPRFLGYFAKTPRFAEQVKAQGSTNYAAIRPSDVLTYEIPLPPLEEQRRIVSKLDGVSARVMDVRGARSDADGEVGKVCSRAAAHIFDQAAETYPLRELSQVVTVRGGGTPSKTNPSYWTGPIPWISPKDMKVRELHGSIDHISKEATEETAARLIQPGAVLVVVRGMILAHTFPSAVLRTHAAINQDVKALVPDPVILPEFLCSLFWAYNARILALVEKSSHDTRRLETAALLDTKIPVPPNAGQHRIVAEVDALQAKVDALKVLQAETQRQIDALMPAVLDRAFRGEL